MRGGPQAGLKNPKHAAPSGSKKKQAETPFLSKLDDNFARAMKNFDAQRECSPIVKKKSNITRYFWITDRGLLLANQQG